MLLDYAERFVEVSENLTIINIGLKIIYWIKIIMWNAQTLMTKNYNSLWFYVSLNILHYIIILRI